MSMCKNCTTRDFVHANLYCQDCPDKPKPKIKKGTAYLFRNTNSQAVVSVEIEVPEGMERLVSAHKLMKAFKVEFIEDETIALAELIAEENNNVPNKFRRED